MKALPAFFGGVFLLLAGAAGAQDLQGRDTAGNWRVTHHSSHGIWNTICDEREERGALKQRCYIRWVDVYAEAPQFGALFTFITPSKDGSRGKHDVMFGPELGTAFLSDGFRIMQGEDEIWKMEDRRCLLWSDCTFSQVQSSAALKAMLAGDIVEFDFVDRNNRRFRLEWPLDGFPEAFETYEKLWAERQ